MTNHRQSPTQEIDTLNRLVSEAIGRAERTAIDVPHQRHGAWLEVATWERQLANLLPPDDAEGRIARRGTISAYLSAGRRAEAEDYFAFLRSDPQAHRDDIARIEAMFHAADQALKRQFPALASSKTPIADVLRFARDVERNPHGFLQAA